jgi:hypothetical protein
MTIDDSEFSGNGDIGLNIELEDLELAAGANLDFNFGELVFRDNQGYGFYFTSENVQSPVSLALSDSYFEENFGSGLGIFVHDLNDQFDVELNSLSINENSGNGLYVRTDQQYTYTDTGPYQPHGTFNLKISNSDITDNGGTGVEERHYVYGYTGGGENTKLISNVVIDNVKIEGNYRGYYMGPYSSYTNQYGLQEATWTFRNTDIMDNRYEGIYIRHRNYNYHTYGNTHWEVNVENSTVSYNGYGIRAYYDQYSYGVDSFVRVIDSTISNNDWYALHAEGYRRGIYNYVYQEELEWNVQESLIDGAVYLDLAGFYSYSGRWDPTATVIFINNTYSHDQPMYINMESYYYDYYKSLTATLIYKGNVHTSSSLDDALDITMKGATQVRADIQISDLEFYYPLGDGIRITLGTLYTSTQYTRAVGGSIFISNVTVDGAVGNGIGLSTENAVEGGVFYNLFIILEDVVVSNCDIGLNSENMNGEVKNCRFTNLRQYAIYVHGGVLDVYSSIVGPIKTSNLYVDEMGAIRLWFNLQVYVVWEDTGLPVVGAQVDLRDNSWKIIGVSGIEGAEGILFNNLNSHTILNDGVFTRNPYLINVDFIGIQKEVKTDVVGHSERTIKLRDNIQPRLFIETPEDSHQQRETSVEVRGNAYDRHTGIDRVEVSLNEGIWYLAEGTDIYSHTFHDLPEGISVIKVRTFDKAKNMKETQVTIYVDTTPPTLSVVSPMEGAMTSNRYLDIIGTSDVGATVLINNQHVELDYTLISHQLVLVEGINEIRVAALDALGNVQTITRNVTLDTYVPFISILTDDVVVNTPKVTLVGMTEESGVIVTVDGNEVAIGSDGMFEAEVSLDEGMNLIEVYATDVVGNDRTVTVKMTLDLVPPWFEVELPAPNTISNTKNVLVKGFVEEGAQLFVNDKVVTMAFGQFETYVNAPEGESELVLLAIDAAGNELERKIPIEVDSVDPVLTILFPPEEHLTNVDIVRVEGFINPSSEDLTLAELFVSGVPWSFDKDSGEFRGEVSLEEGINRVTVKVKDRAGNVDEAMCSVMLDSEAPFLDVKLVGVRMDPQWNQPVAEHDYVHVTGFTEIGTTPTVNDVFVKVDPETGYFNYTLELIDPPKGSTIASTTIVVMSTDAAGNTAMETLEVNRLRDTKKEEDKATSAEWLVLLLALIIFGMAFIGALAYQRFQTQEETIEELEGRPSETMVTESGRVVSRPPERPHRGGVARRRPVPKVEEEEEVVLELDEEVD